MRKILNIKYEDDYSLEDQLTIIDNYKQNNKVILLASKYKKSNEIIVYEYERNET
jgi:hypothetical protein